MMDRPKATVAIAHTSEKHRSRERVQSLVREAIDLLGGMNRFVKPGETVLLKPNQTVFYSAEEGCTTDPLVVGALIQLVHEAGASRVQVGESSGGFFSSLECMKVTGIAAVAEREGAELVDLGSDDTPNRTLRSIFLVGDGVTLPGTVSHVKGVLDSMLRRGELEKVIWLKGTPTIMIGAVEDPNFEEHLKEGPYIVFDDSARPEYKNDPRVYFIPGHPVLQTAMPELMKGLGVDWPGQAMMKWEQFERRGMHDLQYGTSFRKAVSISRPLVIGGLVATGVVGVRAVWRILKRRLDRVSGTDLFQAQAIGRSCDAGKGNLKTSKER